MITCYRQCVYPWVDNWPRTKSSPDWNRYHNKRKNNDRLRVSHWWRQQRISPARLRLCRIAGFACDLSLSDSPVYKLKIFSLHNISEKPCTDIKVIFFRNTGTLLVFFVLIFHESVVRSCKRLECVDLSKFIGWRI